MTNPYPLQRALEVILSINLDVMTAEDAIYYAKELAHKGLLKYGVEVPPLKGKSNVAIFHGPAVPIRASLLEPSTGRRKSNNSQDSNLCCVGIDSSNGVGGINFEEPVSDSIPGIRRPTNFVGDI